ncbi:hypothetical protein [Pedobacter montanisoli]|uniref:Lipoprotein n=1 Tax=Pedobacter montanisoli TaxID=2923277 RepID=A0ABS9ZZI3_9SPHI|nr:hypothetical protein [Pedobacter montanisoli]MCJ0743714.1 hypothetical protein [Pedobacter montanisoli]
MKSIKVICAAAISLMAISCSSEHRETMMRDSSVLGDTSVIDSSGVADTAGVDSMYRNSPARSDTAKTAPRKRNQP